MGLVSEVPFSTATFSASTFGMAIDNITYDGREAQTGCGPDTDARPEKGAGCHEGLQGGDAGSEIGAQRKTASQANRADRAAA